MLQSDVKFRSHISEVMGPIVLIGCIKYTLLEAAKRINYSLTPVWSSLNLNMQMCSETRRQNPIGEFELIQNKALRLRRTLKADMELQSYR